MDVFLLESMEIIFKVALALLTIAKDNILSLDMEGMLKVSSGNHACLCIYIPCKVSQICILFA